MIKNKKNKNSARKVTWHKSNFIFYHFDVNSPSVIYLQCSLFLHITEAFDYLFTTFYFYFFDFSHSSIICQRMFKWHIFRFTIQCSLLISSSFITIIIIIIISIGKNSTFFFIFSSRNLLLWFVCCHAFLSFDFSITFIFCFGSIPT